MADNDSSGGVNVGLVAVLALAYAGSQWLMLTAIDTKLQALEQRIVDSAGHVSSSVRAVEDRVVAAGKAGDATNPAPASEPSEAAADPAMAAKAAMPPPEKPMAEPKPMMAEPKPMMAEPKPMLPKAAAPAAPAPAAPAAAAK